MLFLVRFVIFTDLEIAVLFYNELAFHIDVMTRKRA